MYIRTSSGLNQSRIVAAFVAHCCTVTVLAASLPRRFSESPEPAILIFQFLASAHANVTVTTRYKVAKFTDLLKTYLRKFGNDGLNCHGSVKEHQCLCNPWMRALKPEWLVVVQIRHFTVLSYCARVALSRLITVEDQRSCCLREIVFSHPHDAGYHSSDTRASVDVPADPRRSKEKGE